MVNTSEIIQTMQASIAPCVLLSGFGFLLLTMTNRLGRATDRVRALNAKIDTVPEGEKRNLSQQIQYLFKRCQILQLAIALITLCILFVGMTVFILFFTFTLKANLNQLIQFCFASSVLLLILSLSCFMVDISITLKSLRLELKKHVE